MSDDLSRRRCISGVITGTTIVLAGCTSPLTEDSSPATDSGGSSGTPTIRDSPTATPTGARIAGQVTSPIVGIEVIESTPSLDDSSFSVEVTYKNVGTEQTTAENYGIHLTLYDSQGSELEINSGFGRGSSKTLSPGDAATEVAGVTFDADTTVARYKGRVNCTRPDSGPYC